MKNCSKINDFEPISEP